MHGIWKISNNIHVYIYIYIYSKYILIIPCHLQLHLQITFSQSYTYISHHPLPCCTSHHSHRLHLKVLILFRTTVYITKLIASFSSLRCNFLSLSSKHSSFYPTLKHPQKYRIKSREIIIKQFIFSLISNWMH